MSTAASHSLEATATAERFLRWAALCELVFPAFVLWSLLHIDGLSDSRQLVTLSKFARLGSVTGLCGMTSATRQIKKRQRDDIGTQAETCVDEDADEGRAAKQAHPGMPVHVSTRVTMSGHVSGHMPGHMFMQMSMHVPVHMSVHMSGHIAGATQLTFAAWMQATREYEESAARAHMRQRMAELPRAPESSTQPPTQLHSQHTPAPELMCEWVPGDVKATLVYATAADKAAACMLHKELPTTEVCVKHIP